MSMTVQFVKDSWKRKSVGTGYKVTNMAAESETLALQLSEIEILSSMFVNEKEINVDQASLAEIHNYISGTTTVKPKRVCFTLCLSLGDTIDQLKREDSLEISCCFPHKYPEELPEVYVKCGTLTRALQKELNDSITAFLSQLELGELCVVTLVQWLQENWPEFYERSRQLVACEDVNFSGNKQRDSEKKLTRMWLYMHHIYNKTKRKNILDWAVENKLTGFSLPGKPGVVCIEGDERDTEEYFSRLRRLNWKKITCRHRENQIDEPQFHDFQELVFHVHGSGDDRMNMGEFFQFLVKHDLGGMFKILFGIEGK